MSSATFRGAAMAAAMIACIPAVHARLQTQAKAAGKGAPAIADAGLRRLLEQGETALRSNDLNTAERDFRQAIALDPELAGAYANLGVIYMRRKQWHTAREMLLKAERLAPQVAGIRLNIGLSYYRENDFHHAIAPFETVVREVPTSYQARYLLGFCYFFDQRYAEAVSTLEPLWPAQPADQMNYLYVLGIAAGKAGRSDLEEKSLGRLVETREDTPEFHLLMGKAHLNREEYDDAITELEAAAKAAPKLPFVHFNLGSAYLKKQDLDRAKVEFLEDAAIEPDVAYNYDQLGQVYYLQQQDAEAERMFRKALRLDPRLSSSNFQLARVYLRQSKYTLALAQIDAAARLNPESESVHYVRGQILQRLGRTREAKLAMQKFTEISNAARDKRHRELEAAPVPDPQLTQEPR